MSNTPTQRLDADARETPSIGPLVRFGDYELGARLAVGGMAEIYLAHKAGVLGFRKPLVIKRMRRELANDPDFTKMFVDEARICATLTHTNIVSVFDLGEVDGQLFIAMEYVEGVDCARLQEAVSPLPYEASIAICIAALRGLHHAHSLQVIHRDISPHNILIGVDGAVKVTDFGIARAAERLTHTVPGVLKGKIAYMSPEQASAMPLDRRSDLFACALTAYEMLAGRRAYQHGPETSLLSLVRLARISPLSEVNSDIPKRVSSVFARALAASPEDRYTSCAQLADALALACQGWIEPAHPEALGRLARGALGGVNETFVVRVKKKKTRRTFARVMGAAGVLALAGAAFVFWPQPPAPIATSLPVDTLPPLPVTEPPVAPVTAPPVTERAERGYLTLNSGPWANVFLGARKLGVTPIHKLSLPAGKHRLRLESPSAKKTQEIVVDIEPGKTVTRIVWFDGSGPR